jgi:hypothetical protein
MRTRMGEGGERFARVLWWGYRDIGGNYSSLNENPMYSMVLVAMRDSMKFL